MKFAIQCAFQSFRANSFLEKLYEKESFFMMMITVDIVFHLQNKRQFY